MSDCSSDVPFGGVIDLRTGHLTLGGELDSAARPHLEALLTTLTAAGPRVWLVDLGDVTFCDVPALRMFLSARRTAVREGADLLLVDARPWLRHLFRLVGLEDALVDPVPVHHGSRSPGSLAAAP